MNTKEAGPDQETLDVIVGRKLHMMMWDRKISQTTLAARLGMTQSNLSKKLRGDRGWSLDELKAVSAEMHVKMASLLGEEEETPGPNGPTGETPMVGLKARSLDYKADVSGVLPFPSLGDDGQLPYIPLRTIEAPAASVRQLRPTLRKAA